MPFQWGSDKRNVPSGAGITSKRLAKTKAQDLAVHRRFMKKWTAPPAGNGAEKKKKQEEKGKGRSRAGVDGLYLITGNRMREGLWPWGEKQGEYNQ